MENTKLNKKTKMLKKQGYLPELNPIPQDIYDTELIIPCNKIKGEKTEEVRYFFCTTLGQSVYYKEGNGFLKTNYHTNMVVSKGFPLPQEYDLYSIFAILTGNKTDIEKIKKSKTLVDFYLGNNPYARIPIDMLFVYSNLAIAKPCDSVDTHIKNVVGYPLIIGDVNEENPKPTHIRPMETFYAKYHYNSDLNIKKPVFMKIVMHGILYREIR